MPAVSNPKSSKKKLALHWQILLAMVVAAVLGVVLNLYYSAYETSKSVRQPAGEFHFHGMKNKVAVPESDVWVRTEPRWTLVQIVSPPVQEPEKRDKNRPNILSTARRIVITADSTFARQKADAMKWPSLPAGVKAPEPRFDIPTIGKLKSADPAAYVLYMQHGRSLARKVGDFAKIIGDLFLRLLKMVSIPLIITSLITGVTGLGQAERLGKMFGRTLLYYMTTSLLAIVAGLVIFNIIQPGKTATLPAAEMNVSKDVEKTELTKELIKKQKGKALSTVLLEQVETMIPPNPVRAVTEGKFLSVISFSLAFGICTILVGGKTAEVIHHLFEAAFEVMMHMTMLIIRLAPIGVFFLMLSATATQGLVIFGTLGWYMLTVACALLFHAVVVLPLILKYVAKRSPWEFAKAMSPALFTAFSSASSNGTLPLTLTSVEERAGISNRIGSFVLPLGATINMDGTALYEVIAVMFIANMTPGFEMSLYQQVLVAYTALLASIGAAGIPHAGLVMMVIILQTVGLPTEQQGLIIAVDRVLDMMRTTVNVWSDSCGCAVISRFETDVPEGNPSPEAPSERPASSSNDDFLSGEATVDI